MENYQDIKPPHWPLWLLKFFIHQDYIEEIAGDLEELFFENLSNYSKSKARWIYTKEVLKLYKPMLVKSLEGTYKMNNYGIFKNYLKVASRNIKANKLHSAIKIVGLTIALITSMAIYQHIAFEKSFDLFHPSVENLYRVEMDRYHAGVLQGQKSTSYSAFGPDAKQDIPGIESFARIRIRNSSIVVKKGALKKTFSIKKPAFVDPSFLKLFQFGSLDETLLEDPKSIILTESTAKKYFGDIDPEGETVLFMHGRYELPLIVKAVIPDVQPNSHVQFEALVPYQAIFPKGDFATHSWEWSGVTTYLKLRADINPVELESAFPAFVKKYKGDKMKERDMDYRFSLRPVRDIHLQGHLDGELEANGNEQSLYFLSIAVLLILAISWLNNVNLTSAQNTTRSKEMSVRRVLGAHKKQIFSQLFVESLITHGVAMFLAITIIFSVQAPLENWLNINLSLGIFYNSTFWLIAIGYVIFGSAFVSMDFNMIFRNLNQTETSVVPDSRAGIFFRKFGVAFQFGISLILIVITWAVNSQLEYIQSYNLGLDKEHTIVIEKPRLAREDRQGDPAIAFQTNLNNLPWVESFSSSYHVPGDMLGWSGGIRQKNQSKDYGRDVFSTRVSDDYIKTLGLNLIAGKQFKDISCKEHRHIIVNRKAATLLGFDNPESAINATLINSVNQEHRIVGVIEDFHFSSLRDTIEPMMFTKNSRLLDQLFVKIGSGDLFNQINEIEKTWNNAYPNVPFNFSFLNDHIDRQYQADTEFRVLFTVFSSVGTCLALMGILGLSSFYASRRTKEIGIRKVLGASLSKIIWLLSARFFVLIIIGSIVAVPISYYLISTWLQDFAYQVGIGWWWFAGSFLLILFLAWTILSFQTLKTARVNPADCLKDE